MKSNFSLKFKLFDIFIVAFLLVAIVISIVTTNVSFVRKSNKPYYVQIYYYNELLDDKIIKLNDVQDEIEIVLTKDEYNKLLGDVTILINKDKGICISEVTCPNNNCKKMGWVNFTNYAVTCLPNNVRVIIFTPEVDQDIVLGWYLWKKKL